MAFELHPILSAGQRPREGVWYAIAPENGSSPGARVGASASHSCAGVWLSAGATSDGPFSDLYQLKLSAGEPEMT